MKKLPLLFSQLVLLLMLVITSIAPVSAKVASGALDFTGGSLQGQSLLEATACLGSGVSSYDDVSGCSLVPKGGAQRAAKFASNWPTASLDDALSKFAGKNPLVTTTDKGKKIFTNSETGVQVVQDVNGNYFRIYDPSILGKRGYLDMNGNVPNNKTLENGKQAGRSQSEYNQITHFNIE
jgi:hypothetical protein